MNLPQVANEVDHVPCPFCALLCDDLRVVRSRAQVEVTRNGCERSRRLFPAASAEASPVIAGQPASLDDAMARAADILRSARHPAFVSAGADVAGVRAMIDLAEHARGYVDHADSPRASRNLRVLQDSGWISTTLAEVRNRADVLVLVGGPVGRHLPRFHERCFSEAASVPDSKARETWIIGGDTDDIADDPRPERHLAAKNDRLAEVFSAMAAQLAGRTLRARSVAGIDTGHLAELVGKMKAARYGVLAWSAADLDFPHAELAIQAMCDLVRLLNLSTRFAILQVAGPRADVTATQVTTWQTGIPLRVNFASGAPAHFVLDRDPRADAVFYVAPLATALAPAAMDSPLVVLGHAGAASWSADVFIPVATPGVHHAGHYYRTDGIVALRMDKLLDRPVLPAAEALKRLASFHKGSS